MSYNTSNSRGLHGSPNGTSGDKQNGSSEGSPMEVRKSLSPGKSDESNSSFEKLSGTEVVECSTLIDIIKTLRSKQYIVQAEDHLAEGKCRFYFNKDYRCEVISNRLCPNYPAALLVPVAVKENEGEGSPMDFNKELYTELVGEAVHARIRSRYAVPVILFDNKFICRSGTLTNRTSAAYNQTLEALSPATPVEPLSVVESAVGTVSHIGKCIASGVGTIANISDIEGLFKKDAEILTHLKVHHVCDLMVEFSKTFKDVIRVSSCEILHNDIYRAFKMEDLPFPGCEFFELYSKAGRNPEGLKFDWSQSDCTRILILSDDLKTLLPDLDVSKMQEWDLVEITKNYLRIMLAYLVKGKGGLLVHCISGWDRTPLFITLLRLSLWADNVVHPSLEPDEMAYLTVAYDWYLFGHAFPNRWAKKEEVMHFCFNFLQYITTDEFSITKMFMQLPAEEREKRQFPEYKSGRRGVLNSIRQAVLDAYQEHVIDWEGEKREGA